MVTNMLIFAGEEAKLDYGPEHWLPWLRAGHPLTSSICTKYCGCTDPYVWLTEFLAEKNHIILPPLRAFRYNCTPLGRVRLTDDPAEREETTVLVSRQEWTTVEGGTETVRKYGPHSLSGNDFQTLEGSNLLEFINL
jgi:hypothetical protein